MYLTDLLIENVGPIERFDLNLPMASDGRPKPVVLVGANGSGKTITQAVIADALILTASSVYRDIAPRKDTGMPILNSVVI